LFPGFLFKGDTLSSVLENYLLYQANLSNQVLCGVDENTLTLHPLQLASKEPPGFRRTRPGCRSLNPIKKCSPVK
jgi:hypothetical protein